MNVPALPLVPVPNVARVASLSVVVLGDESGYSTSSNQKMKLAAIEGMWETQKAPADLTLIAIPDQENRVNHYEVKLPYALGLMATRSLHKEVPGINDLVQVSKNRIENGLTQYHNRASVFRK
jgi:cytochrome d ubiquinol oxidase subunit I